MASDEQQSGFSSALIGAAAAIIVALCTAVVAIATGWLSYASKGEELRVHLVEIAVGILRAKPEDDIANARAWAIDVIELNSGVKFKLEYRDQLLHKPISKGAFSTDFSSDFSGRGAITGAELQRMNAQIGKMVLELDKLKGGGAAPSDAKPPPQ